MNHVLTLISSPLSPDLDQKLADGLRKHLEDEGASAGDIRWLCPDQACEMGIETDDPKQVDSTARRVLQGRLVDVLVQPAESEDWPRRKKLLIADMDSTIVQGETLDELAKLVGVGKEVAEITNRSMNGEVIFVDALNERLMLLRGVPVEMTRKVLNATRLMPGAQTLTATMRRNGGTSVLASGGFDIFAEPVCRLAGFDRHVSNALVIEDGKLTGQAVHPVVSPDVKRETLLSEAEAKKLPINATLAVGDGANDIPMLTTAGLGIAYRPKPVVAKQAKYRIDHGDLTALLYAQGYHRDEFKT